MLRIQKRRTTALINEVTSSTDNLIKLFRITSFYSNRVMIQNTVRLS